MEMKRIRSHTDVAKRQRNGVRARIKSAIEKYGFDETRLVSIHYFNEVITKQKLADEITAKEKELKRLKENK